MTARNESDPTRRRFLGQLASLAALAAAADSGNSLWAGEPAYDPWGSILPLRSLGQTGEKVTMLGLGGAHLEFLDDRAAQAMIEAAIEQGIRFFDNSQGYEDGESEAKYGRSLTPKYREDIFLMTKTDARDAASARTELESSLRRLATDHLDLWQVHAIESAADVDERHRNGVFQVMTEAKQSGKVRHLGFTGHRTPAAHLRILEITDQFEVFQSNVARRAAANRPKGL
jgi:predicted aldo/keto reductase-like oxidoreductase